MQFTHLQAVELLREHQHSVKELKKEERNRFTSKARTIIFSQIRPSAGGGGVFGSAGMAAITRPAEPRDKVTALTSASGKEDEPRFHLAAVQQLSST